MKYRYYILILLMQARVGFSQNVTSPYSILGIGDLETREFSRYSSAGHTGLAQRNPNGISLNNPASLTALPYKTIHFDVAMRGKVSHFQFPGEDTGTAASKDYVIKQVSLAFRLNKKTGISAGIRQYSAINYKYNYDKLFLDGNTTYTKSVEGNGGINQVFLSAGRTAGTHWSVGITASWLFGTLQRTTTYTGSSISLNLLQQEDNFLNAVKAEAGIQYYTGTARRWQHTAGATFSAATSLKGQLTSSYSENGTAITEVLAGGLQFKLPVTAGLAYTATWRGQLQLSIQANYAHWEKQKVNYKNAYTAPAAGFGAGVQYAFFKNVFQGKIERSFLSMGVHTSTSYIRINNQPLRDYAITAGGGFNPFPQISLYTGFEWGVKGQLAVNQVRENYMQFNLGITLKDIWMGTQKTGRFR
ncbi:MAG: hypothetical protein NTW29_02445 [Bacteroidetes bacterium]|nr:hypothetical protein [Bacteroidota bacterium]